MKVTTISYGWITFLLLCMGVKLNAQEHTVIEKIWDAGKHNAFPDLIFAHGYYYCTFREGNSHIDNSNDGQVRVMRSKDLSAWEKVALFVNDSADVREARLSVMPDGRILANLAVGLWKDGYQWLKSYVSLSDPEGQVFSPIQEAEVDPKLTPARDWIWRVTWHNNVGYGIMYRVFPDKRPWEIVVVKTTDGQRYDYVSHIPVDGQPNESTIRFDESGKMYVMIRREAGDKMGKLAVANPPYVDWSLNDLTWQLGGPNFLFLNENQLVMGSRFNQKEGAETGLFITDLQGVVSNTIALPSSGDNSYPGMVIRDGKLIVAYYSSHEGKSSIYLAKIPLGQLQVKGD